MNTRTLSAFSLCLLFACDSKSCEGTSISRFYGYSSQPPMEPHAPMHPPRTQLKVIMPDLPDVRTELLEYRHEVLVLTKDYCYDSHTICEGKLDPHDIHIQEGKHVILAPTCTAEPEDFGGLLLERHWTIYYPSQEEPGQWQAHSTMDAEGIEAVIKQHGNRTPTFCWAKNIPKAPN